MRVRKIVRNREAVLGDAFDVIVRTSRRRVGRLHRVLDAAASVLVRVASAGVCDCNRCLIFLSSARTGSCDLHVGHMNEQ